MIIVQKEKEKLPRFINITDNRAFLNEMSIEKMLIYIKNCFNFS